MELTNEGDTALADRSDNRSMPSGNAALLRAEERIRAQLASGALTEALAGTGILVERWPDYLKTWLLHVGVLSRLRLRQQALEAATEATARFPERAQAWVALARTLLLVRNPERCREALATARRYGAQEIACAAVERFAERLQQRFRESDLVRHAIANGARRPPLRPPLVDHPDRDVQVAAATGPADAVVVFTGMADRVGVPLEVLDLYFAARGMTAIYCRDFGRRIYTCGIASLGSSLTDTVSALDALLKVHQARQVLFMGNSAGVFAAIRYGILLRAKCVLAFAGPTNVTRAFLEQVGDNRGGELTRRLQATTDPEQLDLMPAIAAMPESMTVQLHFGSAMPEDRAHADYLRGQRGVTLVAEPGFGEHALLRHLLATGRFDALLEAALDA